MLTIKAEVQKDRKRNDGSYNVKIRFTKDRTVKRISTNLFATDADLTSDLKLREDSMTKQEADRLVLHYRTLVNSLHLDSGNDDVSEIVNRLLCKEEAEKPIDFIAFSKKWISETTIKGKDNYTTALNSFIRFLGKEELEIKNQQQYYRLVVENEGDIAVAEAQYQQFEALQNENFNIGKQMVEWVTYGDRTNTDVQVRKFALQSTKDWFRSALEKWTSALKTNCPLSYGIAIDGWTGVSNARDLDEQVLSMKNYYENNKFKMVCINNFNIAAVIVFLISLAITVGSIVSTVKNGFTPALIVGIVLMLASAGFIAFRIISGLKKFAERVETNIRNLQMTIAQIVEFQRFFTENINKTDDILSKLEYI